MGGAVPGSHTAYSPNRRQGVRLKFIKRTQDNLNWLVGTRPQGCTPSPRPQPAPPPSAKQDGVKMTVECFYCVHRRCTMRHLITSGFIYTSGPAPQISCTQNKFNTRPHNCWAEQTPAQMEACMLPGESNHRRKHTQPPLANDIGRQHYATQASQSTAASERAGGAGAGAICCRRGCWRWEAGT